MATVTLPVDTVINDYRIVSVQKSDELGTVYLAEHNLLKHRCLLREFVPTHCAALSPDSYTLVALPGKEQALQKAYDEFAADLCTINALQHPALSALQTAFCGATGTVYAELCITDVKPIVEALNSERVTENQILPLLKSALDALKYLLKKGLLPTDLNPAQVGVVDGELKLTLFGALRRVAKHAVAGGTPGYAALEQLQGENPGVPAVIYSLGAVLYRVITGNMPVAAPRRIGKFDSYRPLIKLPKLQERFSEHFLSTVDKALSLWIEDRWQDYDAWLAGLTPPEKPKEEPTEATAAAPVLSLGDGNGLKLGGGLLVPSAGGAVVASAPAVEESKTLKLGSGTGIFIKPALVVSSASSPSAPKTLGAGSGLKLGSGMSSLSASASPSVQAAPNPNVKTLGKATGLSLSRSSGLSIGNGVLKSVGLPTASAPVSASLTAAPKVSAPLDLDNLSKSDAKGVLQELGIAEDEYAEKLLHYACAGDLKMLRILLAAGADPSGDGDDYGFDSASPMYLVISHNGDNDVVVSMVKALLDAGINVDEDLGYESPLIRAIYSNATSVMEYLIENGADVNIGFGEGGRPMHAAVDVDNTDYLNMLVDAGADPEWVDEFGNTALQYAARNGKIKSLRWLLMKGVNRNVSDNYGDSILDVTTDEECRKALSAEGDVQRNKIADLMSMISAKTGLQNPDADEDAPWVALENGSTVNLRNALMYFGDVNQLVERDGDNWSLLMYAVVNTPSNRVADCIAVLVEAGADVNLKHDGGLTALHQAANHASFDAISALMEAGANADLMDDNGQPPMAYCSDARCIMRLCGVGF